MKHSDNDKSRIKPNTRIKVSSPEHSEYIQKLAFEAGFKWSISGKKVVYTDENHLSFHKDYSLTWGKHPNNYDEIFIDLPPKETVSTNIKPPFKFKNANLPVVRQWLKDNGYRFEYPNNDILKWNIADEFGYVDPQGFFATSSICDEYMDSIKRYEDHRYPEITFNLSINSVTIDNSKRIKELEDEVKTARKVLEDLETKLKEVYNS